MGEEPSLTGATVLDIAGHRLGVVSDLLIDPVDREARWIRIALAGDGADAVLPAAAVSSGQAGTVTIPFDEPTLRAAPSVGGGVVTDEQAGELRRHYGFVGGYE